MATCAMCGDEFLQHEVVECEECGVIVCKTSCSKPLNEDEDTIVCLNCKVDIDGPAE